VVGRSGMSELGGAEADKEVTAHRVLV